MPGALTGSAADESMAAATFAGPDPSVRLKDEYAPPEQTPRHEALAHAARQKAIRQREGV